MKLFNYTRNSERNSETRREDKVQKCNGSAMYFPESSQSGGIFPIGLKRLVRYPFCAEIEEYIIVKMRKDPICTPSSIPPIGE